MHSFVSIVVALASLTAASPVPAHVVSMALIFAQIADDRRNFEAGLQASPGGAVFQAIKRLFPAEYEALIDEQLKAAAPHLGDPAALLRSGRVPILDFSGVRCPIS